MSKELKSNQYLSYPEEALDRVARFSSIPKNNPRLFSTLRRVVIGEVERRKEIMATTENLKPLTNLSKIPQRIIMRDQGFWSWTRGLYEEERIEVMHQLPMIKEKMVIEENINQEKKKLEKRLIATKSAKRWLPKIVLLSALTFGASSAYGELSSANSLETQAVEVANINPDSTENPEYKRLIDETKNHRQWAIADILAVLIAGGTYGYKKIREVK